MSTRAAARAAIKTALVATTLFADVLEGAPGNFDAKSPIAVVRSRSFERIPQARGLWTNRYGIEVTVYVMETTGTPAQVEATLDAIVQTLFPLLEELTPTSDDTLNAIGPSGPPDGDVSQRTVDGKVYRAERIPVLWDAED